MKKPMKVQEVNFSRIALSVKNSEVVPCVQSKEESSWSTPSGDGFSLDEIVGRLLLHRDRTLLYPLLIS
jgi:hypothetical protein